MKLKNLLKRKPLFLIPLIGLGFVFNTNSSLADLKNQYNTQKECTQESADFIYSGVGSLGLQQVTRYFCIDKSTNAIWYSSKLLRTLFLGYLGQKVNSNKTITQYEIEGNILVRYTCMADDYFSLDCASDVRKKIIAKRTSQKQLKSKNSKTKNEIDHQYNKLLNEYNNLSPRDKEKYEDLYMKELSRLKNEYRGIKNPCITHISSPNICR